MLKISVGPSVSKAEVMNPNCRRHVAIVVTTRLFLILLAVVVAGRFAARETIAQDTVARNNTSKDVVAFDPFSSRHDHFFPPEMTHWALQDKPMIDGLRKAEALRVQLLARDSFGQTPLDRILMATADLQAAAVDSLKPGQPIGHFNLNAERIAAQLSGEGALSAASFAAFDGRWFGRWEDSNVNHDWQPTVAYATPRKTEDDLPMIQSLQYAWISNGFGWNYLVAKPSQNSQVVSSNSEKANKSYVLGMVYYFDGKDFLTIRGEKAHVGFSDSPNRLIWITEQEVFMEEVFPMQNASETTYAITAMYHDLFSPQPSVASRGTQAIYTRDPGNRPAFRKFQWSLRVKK